MINPTETDIGRKVIYLVDSPRGEKEEGVITSFNPTAVFVRYGSKPTPQATSREDLTWAFP